MGATTSEAFGQLEDYRRDLLRYCYRMLASPFDAEDAVQDTLLRAWRGLDRFEDRSSDGGGLRSWLYRIATNVCLDILKGRDRRALPLELGPAGRSEMGEPLVEATWVQPFPDDRDPAVVAEARETIRLAFIAALQHLAPRQRAVLILRDVLSWRASEVADLLETSEDAINGILKRARKAVSAADLDRDAPPVDPGAEQELLNGYVDAFERYDVDALVALLHEDAIVQMPPFPLWLQGLADIRRFLAGMQEEGGADRLVRLRANGSPAVAVYRPDAEGVPRPYGLMVLDVAERRIAAIHAFLDTSIFAAFGLADQFPAAPRL